MVFCKHERWGLEINCPFSKLKTSFQDALKGELTRKNNFGLFYAEFVADLKSCKNCLLRFAVFLIFALLSVNYITASTWEIPEAETRLSPGVVKILG